MLARARRRFYLTEECCRSTVRSVKVSNYNSKPAIKTSICFSVRDNIFQNISKSFR